MKAEIATIFGASGFVGRAVVEALAKAGYRIRAAVRRPNEALFLKPLGASGQIEPVYADITREETIEKALKGASVAINCVGILYEAAGRRKFGQIQARAPGLIGKHAQKAGIRTLIHISAIGANAKSPAKYARTKAEGERALKKGFKRAIILRPSIIFGSGDSFFNLFAKMAKSPFQPLIIVGPKTRFQPVFVDDIALAVSQAVLNPGPFEGGIFELGGPKIYTFRELIDYMKKVIASDAFLFTLPMPLAAAAGAVFQCGARILPLPPPITLDQVKLLQTDNVASGQFKGFEAFGIKPQPIEAIVPSYLKYLRPKGQFG